MSKGKRGGKGGGRAAAQPAPQLVMPYGPDVWAAAQIMARAMADGGKGARKGRRIAVPPRDTQPYPNYFQLGRPQQDTRRPAFKPTPRNLRYFGRTPYASRAINAIVKPIIQLDWEIVPIHGIEWNSELKRQAEVVTNCFMSPNPDDSWSTFTEQVLRDVQHGAGAIEQHLGGDPSHPLWLYPVDGLSISIYPGWDGTPSDPRYLQTLAYGFVSNAQQGIDLRNDELIYLKPNPTTATPFGFGPLEVAFMTVSRQLGAAEYAGNVASNATPGVAMNFIGADPAFLASMRAYWTNEIEGQGKIPMFGLETGDGKSAGGLEVVNLHPQNDGALYLMFQEMLHREIAVSFDLSPQTLGVERDVNRSTAESGDDRDWEHAVKPNAKSYSAYLTREAIQRKLGFSQLRHQFIGLDREDEEAQANILNKLWMSNAITVDQMSEQLGFDPDPVWGPKRFADMQIAIMSARGLSQNLDKNLGGSEDLPDAKTASDAKDGSIV